RHRHARDLAERADGRPHGRRREPRDLVHVHRRRGARRGRRRHGRYVLRHRALPDGIPPRFEGVFRGGPRRHRQPSRRGPRRHPDGPHRVARRGLRGRLHERLLPQPVFPRLRRRLRGEPRIEPLRQQLQGCVRVHRAHPRSRLPSLGTAGRAGRRPGIGPTHVLEAIRRNPKLKWAGVALIAIALLLLPFALASVGTAWVRITNFAILFSLLALGLNIVVGFAGLLDLGYIAFYGIG